MALEDEIKTKEKSNKKDKSDDREMLTDEEEQELTIIVALSKNLIDDGGIEVIQQAMGSSDPAQVIGQFMMQLLSQLADALRNVMEFSPRIVLNEGGWVEQISDYLQEEYNIPVNIMDRAEIYIGTTAHGMAQTANAQANGQQPMAAPTAPQEAAPNASPTMPTGGM